MTRYEIKQNAKAALGSGIFQNRWLMAVLAIFICSAVTAAAGSVLPAIGGVLISGPMQYGLHKMFLKQSRDYETMQIGDLFKGFSDDFGGTFLLGLMSGIYVFLFSLLLIVPGIIMSYAYSMAFYIKADHPEYGWRQCLEESKSMTYGHKWELFMLDLSFIGWNIVAALCLGVGCIWVNAWQNASKAELYNHLSGYVPEITMAEEENADAE